MEYLKAKLARVKWGRLGLNLLVAFLSPFAVAIPRHTSLRDAASEGAGLAVAAFIAFLQHPKRQEKKVGGADASAKVS